MSQFKSTQSSLGREASPLELIAFLLIELMNLGVDSVLLLRRKPILKLTFQTIAQPIYKSTQSKTIPKLGLAI
jgi:hypothetical protein